MSSSQVPAAPGGEPFVDAREAGYALNLPMYYLTNAAQRAKLKIPHYRIGRMVRFKVSELAEWQVIRGGRTPGEEIAHD